MSVYGPAPVTPGAILCPRCGRALRSEQAWCLECGLAARTRIHPPPNWRLPIAVTLVLLTLLAAGIAVALVALLDTPESTPAPTTVTVPAPAAPVPTPAPTTPSAVVPQTGTTVPGTATVPGTPTTPSTTAPGTTSVPGTATTPETTSVPGTTTTQKTFTIPGTGIRLPSNGD